MNLLSVSHQQQKHQSDCLAACAAMLLIEKPLKSRTINLTDFLKPVRSALPTFVRTLFDFSISYLQIPISYKKLMQLLKVDAIGTPLLMWRWEK
ncbi:MAG: hypothetical protein D8M54_02180 [Chloroflexi bacterium]|nr:hypothetical protein [Chloroflexota bacterium]